MRMWMINPSKMCRKHLLGEHVELHMIVGALKKRKSFDGYVKNNLLEIRSIEKRHNDLVEEMLKRGYNHNSSLECDKSYFNYLPMEQINVKVDSDKSYSDLITRCNKCAELV